MGQLLQFFTRSFLCLARLYKSAFLCYTSAPKCSLCRQRSLSLGCLSVPPWASPQFSAASLALEDVGEPAEGLLQAGVLNRARLKHLPLAVLYLVETEARRHLVVIHRPGHVLFVREDEDGHAAQLVLLQHDLELLLRELEALAIRRVHHEHNSIRVLIVTPPIRP